MRKTLEVSSVSELPLMENESSSIATKKTKKSKSKVKLRVKPEGFPGITALLNNWNPFDPTISRELLVSELRTLLEAEHHTCINSCVPALIVDGSYPIELMHYHTKDDIDEFVARMSWMHHVFKSSIGILVGVTDGETASLIERVCRSLLNMEEDCVILLL